MPEFSNKSKERLAQSDPRLQLLFNEVIKYFDCAVICGYRGKEDQNKAFEAGKSKLQYPYSKHNSNPSRAVDVVPYINGQGVSWNSMQNYHFAGKVLGIATQLGIKIRYGGDWDMDNDILDNNFNDLVHYEIVE